MIVGQLYAPERHAPRRRLLDLLHGDQPRRVHRAARLRLSRPARQLAHRIRGRRRRHGARASSSTCSARKYLGDAGLHPALGRSPEAGRALQTRATSGRRRDRDRRARRRRDVLRASLPITAKQVADAAGYVLLATVDRASSAWLFFAGGLDAGGAAAAVPRSPSCSSPPRSSGPSSSRRVRR